MEKVSEKDKPILLKFNYTFRFHKKLANDFEKWCCTKIVRKFVRKKKL